MCGSTTPQQAAPQGINYNSNANKNKSGYGMGAPTAGIYQETPDPVDPDREIPQDQLDGTGVPLTEGEALAGTAGPTLPTAVQYLSDEQLADIERLEGLEAIANQDNTTAVQARYREDERVKRFRGFGSTILTSGLGVQGPQYSRNLSLIGS